MEPRRTFIERVGTTSGRQELADVGSPVLYQTLGENRLHPSEKTYTSLVCDAGRRHIETTCALPNADRRSPAYENVHETRKREDNDSENVPAV